MKERFSTKIVVECCCNDCKREWDMTATIGLYGKIHAVGLCPSCGGTPHYVRQKTVAWPTGRVLVTEEAEAPLKPGPVLEANW